MTGCVGCGGIGGGGAEALMPRFQTEVTRSPFYGKRKPPTLSLQLLAAHLPLCLLLLRAFPGSLSWLPSQASWTGPLPRHDDMTCYLVSRLLNGSLEAPVLPTLLSLLQPSKYNFLSLYSFFTGITETQFTLVQVRKGVYRLLKLKILDYIWL